MVIGDFHAGLNSKTMSKASDILHVEARVPFLLWKIHKSTSQLDKSIDKTAVRHTLHESGLFRRAARVAS